MRLNMPAGSSNARSTEQLEEEGKIPYNLGQISEWKAGANLLQ